jgi:hypothetical protein
MNDTQVQHKLTDRQTEAYYALNKPDVTDVLYGGAKGGGKSHFLCLWAYLWSISIANAFKLVPSEHPLHVGWIGRKQATDFTGTTLQTWQRIIPSDKYEIKSGTEKHPKHILIENRIAIDFGGLDKQESINKFNSAEYGFVAIDQAEETTRDDVSVLRASRQLTIDGRSLKYKGLYTANPANCWLKDEFLLSPASNRVFVRALPKDNPHLPESYIAMLKDSFGYRPELLSAYLDGNWDAMDDSDQVIKAGWIELASSLNFIQHLSEKRRLLTCDVARFGDDETVIYDMEETDIREERIYGQRDTMYTANLLCSMSMARGDCSIAVDEGGVGGGVVDRLRELDRHVISIQSSEKAMNSEKYYNRRAEVWDYAARQFSEGAVELHTKDPVLKGQLITPKYKFKGARILIEPKEEIKKRLNRSPDRGDAYVNGLWAIQFVEPKISTRGAGVPIPSHLKAYNRGY